MVSTVTSYMDFTNPADASHGQNIILSGMRTIVNDDGPLGWI
ncbi:hypothetical protein ACTUVN_002090 [Pseudomonas caspiana]